MVGKLFHSFKICVRLFVVVSLFMSVSGSELFAQGVYVFPRQGQGQEQQSMDAGSCRSWAMRETGVDPAYLQGQMAMLQNQAASQPRQMPVARSMFRATTTGAMMGSIAENNEDKSERGLKMGAAYGLKQGVGQRIDMQREAQAQQLQQQMGQLHYQQDSYNRAFGACMDARGYSVK